MRIPKSVDRAWDWAERRAAVLGAGLAVIVAAVGALLLPALGALAAGILIGAVLTAWRTSRRLTRLRADNDDLLRQNGALRHTVAALERGVRQRGSVETQVLPFIPDPED